MPGRRGGGPEIEPSTTLKARALEPRSDSLHRRGRDRVQVGDDGGRVGPPRCVRHDASATASASPGGTIESTIAGGLDDGIEARAAARFLRRAAGPRAATLERRDDPRAAGSEHVPDGASPSPRG